MKIFIVGGGQVGSTLAKSLAREGHKITVIDSDERVVEKINSSLDVICYVGNGASFSVLQSAGIEDCDLLIALTYSDEMNLLSCLCAHKLGAKHTVARVRNPEYTSQLYELKKDLGLSMSINPEKAAAEEIARIIRLPSASRVELFARGRVELVSCKIPKGNPLCNIMLKDMISTLGVSVLICAVDRDNGLIIPRGDFVIRGGDEIYVTGAPKQIEKFLRRIDLSADPIKELMILGGGITTKHLCEALLRKNISVKIIESDRSVAEDIAETLPSAVVLHGDSSDHDFLFEEGIKKADAFIALGDTDESNVLSALFARQCGVKKVIAKTSSERMNALTKELDIETSISPKVVTVNMILRFVRAMANSGSSENIMTLCKIIDGRAEVVEFIAEGDIEGIEGVPLKELKLKKNLLIASIVRKGEAIVPGGNHCIMQGDSVLVVNKDHVLNSIADILED
jgi:trk system potassium uptake protein TrkA